MIYELRPHHGLCLGFFRGKGYSGAFVENMARMKILLEAGAQVRLTDRADCICAGCPNRTPEGSCTTADKVALYDHQVLHRCGLQIGTVLDYRKLTQLVQERILDPGARESVCGSCQWTELCR